VHLKICRKAVEKGSGINEETSKNGRESQRPRKKKRARYALTNKRNELRKNKKSPQLSGKSRDGN